MFYSLKRERIQDDIHRAKVPTVDVHEHLEHWVAEMFKEQMTDEERMKYVVQNVELGPYGTGRYEFRIELRKREAYR